MRSRRFTVVLVVLLAIFVGVAALSFGGGAGQVARESARAETPAPVAVERKRPGPATDDAKDGAALGKHARRPDARAREALRQDIVRALERRGVRTDVDAASPRADDEPERPAAGGGMVDRIGDRPALLERFNADFMPLADECMEQARERVPDLHGLVAIDVKLLAERDVGAIVEAAAPAAVNEIADPELLECLQETLMSMALPGDAVDGKGGVMVSLRADADDRAPQ